MKTLTKGNPIKLILIFAIPLFIGQLFQLFYSLVDTRIVGSTLGEASLAAVGATTSLSDLFVSLMNGLTNGFAIIVATYFGASDEKNLKKSVAATFLLGIGGALLFSVLCLIFLHPILHLLNIPDAIMADSIAYIRIILMGLVAATLYNICSAVLRALGDSFTPLFFLIFSTILNIFLDYFFILFMHMGVSGAALATVLSQLCSAILCFVYMNRKYPLLRLCGSDFHIPHSMLRRILSTGISMGFMVSFVYFGTLALQTSINTFGTQIIVAHTAARKATSIFMLPFGVFGTTLATYCGQNLGAGEYKRIKTGMIETILVTWGWCILVLIVAYTISPFLITMITGSHDPVILQTATKYLHINTIFYFIPTMITLIRNSMQGFGDNITPIFSSAVELIGKILVAMFLAPAIGYMGIIVAEPIVWALMVIPLLIQLFRSSVLKMAK